MYHLMYLMCVCASRLYFTAVGAFRAIVWLVNNGIRIFRRGSHQHTRESLRTNTGTVSGTAINNHARTSLRASWRLQLASPAPRKGW